jgi:LacI family transcriptional regulator
LNKKFKFTVLLLQNEGFAYWDEPLKRISKAATKFAIYDFKIDYFFFKYNNLSFNEIAAKV